MDHLPTPAEPIYRPVEVPYLCDQFSVNDAGFWQFPDSQGWDSALLECGLSSGDIISLIRAKKGALTTPPNHFAALLQAWWYFGLLREVLGRDIEVCDFLKRSGPLNSRVITTENLETHLMRLVTQLQGLPPNEAYKRLRNAMDCVDYVHKSVERLAGCLGEHCLFEESNARMRRPISGMRRSADGRISVSDSALDTILNIAETAHDDNRGLSDVFRDSQSQFWARNGREILPEDLELSIGMLGHTLSHAIQMIYRRLGLQAQGPINVSGWYIPDLVRKRLLSSGFCPRVVYRLSMTMKLVGAYLSSLLHFPPEVPSSVSHVDCTMSRCHADYMVDGSYIRSHAETGCSCEVMPEFETSKHVQKILQQGEIPVLRVKKAPNSQEFKIEVLSSRNTSYVAISHVWSDGLGNPDANELFKCQWLRLHHLVDNLVRESKLPTSSTFWIDTICVPVGRGRDTSLRKELRDVAIERMRDTYRQARMVLILDSSLWPLTSDMTDLEFAFRFSYSKWMRRLWTMHEGAVAETIFARIKDGYVPMEILKHKLLQFICDDESILNGRILRSLCVTESITSWSSCMQISFESPQHLFRFVWNESRNRGTKYEEDRYVVIASLLGLRGQQMYAFQRPEDRLKYLFENIAELPSMILFTQGPRIQEPGLRWAPASMDTSMIQFNGDLKPAIRNTAGLMVEFEGVRLLSHPDWGKRFRRSRGWTEKVNSVTADDSGTFAWVVEVEEYNKLNVLYCASFTIHGSEAPIVSESDSLAVLLQPSTVKATDRL
ncbi:hypothetical protein EPUS_00295 [Endocarpon pusillum Z07020]|uniref:Heterokaryon incompatibility domain-containing protein n=1 Tax=Endocarpon pusillum (strain Z07020 / HMAS-L-300199) TaxID=1263415 RepID=U1GDG0_ENDPU|nr:uncharacterized protein EPUS_00295 [Endocarpon pusillum Z07020]ERF70108.1 hypothetical protein EPUS_00295 [Endocarpon pusillum Z07020]